MAAFSRVCWIDGSGRLRCTQEPRRLRSDSSLRVELDRLLSELGPEPRQDVADAILNAVAALLESSQRDAGSGSVLSIHYLQEADCGNAGSTQTPGAQAA